MVLTAINPRLFVFRHSIRHSIAREPGVPSSCDDLAPSPKCLVVDSECYVEIFMAERVLERLWRHVHFDRRRCERVAQFPPANCRKACSDERRSQKPPKKI